MSTKPLAVSQKVMSERWMFSTKWAASRSLSDLKGLTRKSCWSQLAGSSLASSRKANKRVLPPLANTYLVEPGRLVTTSI